MVHQLGGLAIPAHINRRAFGLIELLGFIPPDIPFDALEISRHVTPKAYLASQRITNPPSSHAIRRCTPVG